MNVLASGSLRARALATVVALTVLVALALQYQIAASVQSVTPVWWVLAGYFTILTNLGVAGLMTATALGRQLSARAQGGLVLSILMVGLVYHLFLARLWSPQGLAWWADQGLHTAVPLLTLAWWLACGDRRVTRRDLPNWLIWPATYTGYALLRGTLTGFWPYPFLDAGRLGWAQVALNVAGLVLAFSALGLGLIALFRTAQSDKPS